MKIKFQLLDCDYILVDNKPKIRVFGRDEKGKSICIFYSGFYPYFYILPKRGKESEIVNYLKENFKGLILNIERVEKFLPVGYKEEKEKLLKVTLTNPAKVPTLRENLQKNKNVERTFEADILFKYRFMADFNLLALHWYEVEGNYVNTNSVGTEVVFEGKKFREIEHEDIPLKYISLDLEIISKEGIPDSKKDKIAMISLYFSPSYKGKKSLVLLTKTLEEKNVLCFENEKEMLNSLIKIIDEFDPDFIVGYNINDFDLPYLIDRMRMNKIFPLFGRAKDKGASSRQVGTRKKNRIPGRIIVDVYDILKEFASKGTFRFKRYGLGDVSKILIGETKVDIAHSEIIKFWEGKKETLKKLVEYSRKDAELVLKILLKRNLLDKFIELSKVSGLLLQDVLDMGEAARVENLLLREFNKRGFVIPNKPTGEEYKRREAEREVKGLKGALVLEPKLGFHKNIIYLDFKCFTPGTKILTTNGYKNIEDVEINSKVLSIDNKWHKVVKKFSYEVKTFLTKILLDSGNYLICTPNHKILCLKNGRIVEVFAENLKEGDILLEPLKIDLPDERNDISEEFAELLGIIYAKGSFPEAYQISITVRNKNLIKRIKKILKKEFSYDAPTISQNKNTTIIWITKEKIFKKITTWIRGKSRNRCISGKIFLQNKKIIAAFLRGVFEGNGSINLARRSIVLRIISKDIHRIQELLLRLGIPSTVHKIGRRKIKKYDLTLTNFWKLKKFKEMIGFISEKKKRRLAKIFKSYKRIFKFKEKLFRYAKISKVEKVWYEGKVYDLTINDKPFYFANNVLVHNSMYPSILISFNICPTTFLMDGRKVKDFITTPSGAKFISKKIREGIFPQILSKLIKERDKVKREMRACKDEWKKRALDAKQWGLKYMTNAFYGYTGYTRARFYILDIANAITSCGRKIIRKTKRLAEGTGRYSVVYGDTDSIMVHVVCKDVEEAFKKGKEIEKLINEAMEKIVKIKIEGVFKSLLILSKKRYAGLAVEKEDSGYKEKIIMKGIETVRRDWCELTSKVLYKVLDIILKEQNPKRAFDFVKDVLKKLERNEIPIEDLVITKSISKPIRKYKGIQPHIELVKKMRKRQKTAPGVGDRVSYVIVSGPQLVSHRAEDPEYVVKNKLKIDAKYYIESQILPPLERVFEVLGVSRSQLIGIGKQLLLSEAIKNNMKRKEIILRNFEGFVCDKCNSFYRRIPLLGKCPRCNGEVLFYFKGEKSRNLILS